MSSLKNLDDLLDALDEKSKQMTVYLLNERHAELRELANLICAASDMEVLMIIREIINPKAKEIVGKPIVSFQRSKVDSLTGQMIMFSWWVDEYLASSVRTEELLDIIDEEDIIRIVAELPSTEKQIQVKLAESHLIISGRQYHKELSLPCPVKDKIEKTINNGVLEVKLNKKAVLHCQLK